METDSCVRNFEGFMPVDYFYVGDEAFQKGKRESDMSSTLTNDEQHFWLGGFRSAARRAENPCISAEEYHRIADSAYSAGKKDRENGTMRNNPFDAD